MSKVTSVSSSNLPLLYFDFIAPKEVTNPKGEQVLLTYKGNVFRHNPAGLSFGVPIFSRVRKPDGAELNVAERVSWLAYGLQWTGLYLASFLDAVTANPVEYAELIHTAPTDYSPVILPAKQLGLPNAVPIKLAPRALWTQGSKYTPGK